MASQGYYGPFPTTQNAYFMDASGNEYFGESAKGTVEASNRWQIFQKLNRGTTAQPNWITLFPQDNSGIASDQPTFSWTVAQAGGYTYGHLGTNA